MIINKKIYYVIYSVKLPDNGYTQYIPIDKSY